VCDHCCATYLVSVPLNPPEALAQRQVVADRVPPSSRSCPVVGEPVDDPLVNPFHREQLVRRAFYRHEDQTAERVRRLVWGGVEERVGRRGGLARLWLVDLGQRLDREQAAAPLMQPAQAGQVVLVGRVGGATAVYVIMLVKAGGG